MTKTTSHSLYDFSSLTCASVVAIVYSKATTGIYRDKKGGETEMRTLFISLLITIGFTTIGISAFAETEQQIEEIATIGEAIDNSNFLTIKDEKGEANLIKTIAVLKFGEDHLRLEIGKPVSSTQKKDTTIIEDKTFFE